MAPSATSTCFLIISRDGDSTPALGNLSQCLTTLSMRKFFLISNQNFPWWNSRLFPLVLSLVTWEKSPILIWLHPPVRDVSAQHRAAVPSPSPIPQPHPGKLLRGKCCWWGSQIHNGSLRRAHQEFLSVLKQRKNQMPNSREILA